MVPFTWTVRLLPHLRARPDDAVTEDRSCYRKPSAGNVIVGKRFAEGGRVPGLRSRFQKSLAQLPQITIFGRVRVPLTDRTNFLRDAGNVTVRAKTVARLWRLLKRHLPHDQSSTRDTLARSIRTVAEGA